MLKLTTITFTLIAALSFGASTADAGQFSGNRAPQPTSVNDSCTGHFVNGECSHGPQFGFGGGGPGNNPLPPCLGHHPCGSEGTTVPDCRGGSQTIYGTTHECL